MQNSNEGQIPHGDSVKPMVPVPTFSARYTLPPEPVSRSNAAGDEERFIDFEAFLDRRSCSDSEDEASSEVAVFFFFLPFFRGLSFSLEESSESEDMVFFFFFDFTRFRSLSESEAESTDAFFARFFFTFRWAELSDELSSSLVVECFRFFLEREDSLSDSSAFFFRFFFFDDSSPDSPSSRWIASEFHSAVPKAGNY